MSKYTQQYRSNDHLDGAQTPVTVAQAAQLLGLSAEAVRSRVQRETLASTKVDGKVYVLLDPDQARQNNHLSEEQKADEGRPNEHLSGDQTEFVASLQEQVDWLRREVERKDTLLMTLMQRIPELEGPSEPREEPATPSRDPSNTRVHPQAQRPFSGERPFTEEEPPRRRSWWREFFFGPS